MPNAPVPHLVVAPGKDQNVYIANRDNLGGIGAELSMAHVATNELKTASAAYTTSMGTYVAMHVDGGTGMGCPGNPGGNMVVVKIAAANPPTASVVWCTKESGLGAPIVTTTDGTSNAIVWNANNGLWGYDGDTGAKIFAGGATTTMPHAMHAFNTPIDAKGRIVVVTDDGNGNGYLYTFSP